MGVSKTIGAVDKCLVASADYSQPIVLVVPVVNIDIQPRMVFADEIDRLPVGELLDSGHEWHNIGCIVAVPVQYCETEDPKVNALDIARRNESRKPV
jgi:hypothetical protein